MKSAPSNVPSLLTFENTLINKPEQGVFEELKQSGAKQEVPSALDLPAWGFHIEDRGRMKFVLHSIAQGCGINWRKPIGRRPHRFDALDLLVESLKGWF